MNCSQGCHGWAVQGMMMNMKMSKAAEEDQCLFSRLLLLFDVTDGSASEVSEELLCLCLFNRLDDMWAHKEICQLFKFCDFLQDKYFCYSFICFTSTCFNIIWSRIIANYKNLFLNKKLCISLYYIKLYCQVFLLKVESLFANICPTKTMSLRTIIWAAIIV